MQQGNFKLIDLSQLAFGNSMILNEIISSNSVFQTLG